MPAYRFSWDAFDDLTVEALATALGCPPEYSGAAAREWLGKKKKRPDESFITRETRQVLEQCWLPGYAGLDRMVGFLQDRGIGPDSRPRSAGGYIEFLRKCRTSSTLRRMYATALQRFGDQDRQKEGEEGHLIDGVTVPRFSILETAKQAPDPRNPHPYQLEAWAKLSAHLAESEVTKTFQGLLVMPTGSGKTFTAMRWLMENIVNRGTDWCG